MSQTKTALAACPICHEASEFKYVDEWVAPALKKNMNLLTSHWTLYECSRCSVQFWDPFAQQSQEWEDMSLASAGAKKTALNRFFDRFHIRPWNWRVFLAETPNRGGFLLDVGCGAGAFLDACRRKGYSVFGLDITKKSVALAQGRGIECYLGYVRDFVPFWKRTNRQLFDVITCFEVLEHIGDDPLAFLIDLRSLLSDKGRLAISVPFRDRTVLFEDGDTPPAHLTRWNEASMTHILKKIGLEVEAIYKRPLSFYTVAGNIFNASDFDIFPFGRLSRLIKLCVAVPLAALIWLPLRLRGGYGRNMYVVAREV